MVLRMMSELPDDAPTPFARPGMLSWTVAPKLPVPTAPQPVHRGDVDPSPEDRSADECA